MQPGTREGGIITVERICRDNKQRGVYKASRMRAFTRKEPPWAKNHTVWDGKQRINRDTLGTYQFVTPLIPMWSPEGCALVGVRGWFGECGIQV